ncbi:MAG: DnaJ domain-containing protein [Pseudorhodobacter sp.]|nr:DnaJ domain-containing protein [Pseudorhodobacter sp.]
MDDPYATLGVPKTATADEIKKAHRRLVRTSHPDLNPDDAGAEARFKAISAAYDLLKDPATRARFDAGEIDASGAERPERRYYRDYAETPGNAYQRGGGFETAGDAADIFAEMLRQRGRGGRAGFGSPFGDSGFASAGQDGHYALEVPFLDAVRGARTRITLPDGADLEVQIPRGSADGSILRLRGKGGPGFGGGPTGDAYVTLTVRPDRIFRREGDDIHLDLPITLDEAVLGAKVSVPTIDGTVSLTIPKGVSSGRVLRLRERGVQRSGAAVGDQLVTLSITVPPLVDEKLNAFMEEWRKANAYDPRKDLFEGGAG